MATVASRVVGVAQYKSTWTRKTLPLSFESLRKGSQQFVAMLSAFKAVVMRDHDTDVGETLLELVVGHWKTLPSRYELSWRANSLCNIQIE